MNELDKLSILKEDIYPYTIIMGGAKIADKINVIDKLITKCTNLVIGGIMANTFIKAKGYNIGNSLYETDKISYANSLLDKYNSKIVYPIPLTKNCYLTYKNCYDICAIFLVFCSFNFF